MTQEQLSKVETLSNELSTQINVFSYSCKMVERERLYSDSIRGVNVLSAEQADRGRIEFNQLLNSAEARITQIIRELSEIVHI